MKDSLLQTIPRSSLKTYVVGATSFWRQSVYIYPQTVELVNYRLECVRAWHVEVIPYVSEKTKGTVIYHLNKQRK